MERSGAFLFGISFLVVEIHLHFCIMQMRKVMTSFISDPKRQYNTQSRICREILEQCSLNLSSEMHITKETMTPVVPLPRIPLLTNICRDILDSVFYCLSGTTYPSFA